MKNHGYKSLFEDHSIRFTKVTLGLNLITLLGLVISLSLVVYQLRQNGQGIATANYIAATNWNVELDKIFIEHPDLYPYFYANKKIDPTDNSQKRYLLVSTAETAMDLLDSTLADNNEKWPDPGFEGWAHDLFRLSPVLREHLVERRAWYCRHLYPDFSAWARSNNISAPYQGKC